MPQPAADPLGQAALVVLDCLEEMGARHSNAVLELYPTQGEIIEHHRYPPDGMRIAGDTWRAYYHSHDYPGRTMEEHGHFHIFHRLSEGSQGMQNWAHVAGLAMDREGQPLCWFSVNRWVTDGVWLPADRLDDIVSSITPGVEPPAARWLLGMMKLYGNELASLFRQRDKTLLQHNSNDCTASQEERSVYRLARRNINLVSHLEAILTDSVTSESDGRHEDRC
jgi:hypothetical protein